ncbi:MAG: PQQ-binding-like beta-propeller repeat protein, partial [Pirellulaceae bacterium]
MKLFGLLSALTIVLVVVGFRTGAFPGSDAEPIDKTATAATDESASCCASDTCSCKAAGETTECTGSCAEGGACCQDNTVASDECSGSCAEGGTCCQEEGVSRSSLMMASTSAGPAPGGLVQEESNEAAGISGDWAMWGGALDRNMASDATGINIDFDLRAGQNVNWVANLGSQTYGNAIVAGGKVFVGCNNGAEYRPGHVGDRGCLLCFDEESGEFQWQLTREKLTSGRVNDWPLQGICSTPTIELNEDGSDGVLWVVTNRCELMCVDISGFADGNDGLTDEVDAEMQDADIIWNLDMINELGVFPHNLATSSPLVYEDMVYVLTSNGVDEAHLELPSPRAPSFLAVNKDTGEVVWESNAPFDQVLHGQWGSPTLGMVNGQAQIYFPGGDGWLYALDAKTGEEIWKFDMNPKNTLWELGGRGSRNAVIGTAVFRDNSVLVAVGQDPEHGEGVGHLWRIDATKTGDISPELGEI